MFTFTLAHAMSHMEATPSLWRIAWIRGRLSPAANLEKVAGRECGGEGRAWVDPWVSHIISGRKIMIFRGNLTRNFSPASLG